MNTERIQLTAETARAYFKKYKEHRQFSTEIDREIQRVYRLIAAGKMVIKALESIIKAGLGEDGLPKLALMQADQRHCIVKYHRDGSVQFLAAQWARSRDRRTITLPANTYPRLSGDEWLRNGKAIMPIVPLPHRPKADLANYHILFEAEWENIVPVDPMLLRRLGKGDLWDLWLVLAAWDLTEVERAALASRV